MNSVYNHYSNSPMPSHIDLAHVRSMAFNKDFHLHAPQRTDTPPSGFTESSATFSSSFASSSRLDQQSYPSTSSGMLNSGMQQLMSPRPFPPQPRPSRQTAPQQSAQGAWPPMVIQLEEAPQEDPEPVRTDIDTFNLRMQRIQSWRSKADNNPTSYHSVSSQRSESPNSSHSKPVTQFRCTACDTSYSSRQGLKRHAQGVRTTQACRTAVQYFLE